MDYLARRDHSEKELREKLGKNFTSEEVENAIRECKENHWMSPPEELAERVALSMNRKLKSYNYIKNFLSKKGLPAVPFKSAIEKEKALALIAKLGAEDREYEALFRLLKNRGFDKDTIKKVIHETRTRSQSI